MAALPAPLSRVVEFARSFGESHAALAMHAALPVGLTPNLVHLLRVNFVGRAPWIAEADLLLSPLCAEVGAGSYEMSPAVRKILLNELIADPELGWSRLRLVARFLLEYASSALHRGEGEEERDLLAALQWSALAYLDPRPTAQALANHLATALAKKDTQGMGPLLSIILDLSQVLALDDDLLLYSGALRQLVAGDRTTAVRMLEALGPTDRPVQVGDVPLPAPANLLRSLSPDPASGDEKTPETGKPVLPGLELRATLARTEGRISSLAWAPSREALAIVDQRHQVLWWDFGSGERRPFATARDLGSPVDCVAIAPGGERIALAGETVHILALPDGQPPQEPQRLLEIRGDFAGAVAALSWSPDGRLLLVASTAGRLLLFDSDTGTLRRTVRSRPAAGASFAWTSVGEELFLACLRIEGDVSLLRLKNGRSARLCASPAGIGPPGSKPGDGTAPPPGDCYTSLAWAGDHLFAGLASGGLVRVHSRTREIRYTQGSKPGGLRLSLSSDGSLLASVRETGQTKLWRTDTLALAGAASTANPLPSSLGTAFHPSFPLLAEVGAEGTSLRIWDVDTKAVCRGPHSSYSAMKMVFVGPATTGKAEIVGDLLRLKGTQQPARESRLAGSLDRREWLTTGTLQVRRVFLWEIPGDDFLSYTDLLALAGADLAVVVVDPRASPRKQEFQFQQWSEILTRARPGSPPAIWVLTAQEEGSFLDISAAELGLKGVLRGKTRVIALNVVRGVLGKLEWTGQPAVPDDDVKLFSLLLTRYRKEGRRLLREPELAAFLGAGRTPEEARQAVDDLLHLVETTGKIRRFPRTRQILLEPDLLLLYTEAILEAIESLGGQLAIETDVIQGGFLENTSLPPARRLSPEEEHLFLPALFDELETLGILVRREEEHQTHLALPTLTTIPPLSSSEQEVVERTARLLVQDIYLYNKKRIDRGGELPLLVRLEIARALRYMKEKFGASEAIEQLFLEELRRVLAPLEPRG